MTYRPIERWTPWQVSTTIGCSSLKAVLQLPQHLPAATEKAGLRLCSAGSQWRHIEWISLLIVNFCHVPSTRITEWLPKITHFNIFVLAHKNANEPATNLELWQNSGSSLCQVLWLVLSDSVLSCQTKSVSGISSWTFASSNNRFATMSTDQVSEMTASWRSVETTFFPAY
jgi:hypothetical protein